MERIRQHLVRCLAGGIVALLPIGGLVLTVVYLETTIAGSWLAEQPYYVPGLGIVAAALITYLIGLAVTTFLGRWLWSRVDRVLESLPALGQLYQTLKQILGYGEGKEAVFQGVVLVPSREHEAYELGLVTERLGDGRLSVFVPSAPTPTSGRMLIFREGEVKPLGVPVSEAFKTLLTLGKMPLPVPEGGEGERRAATDPPRPHGGGRD